MLPAYHDHLLQQLADIRAAGLYKSERIITTPQDQPLFQRLLGDGSDLGLRFAYAAQHSPRGLADAFIVGADRKVQKRSIKTGVVNKKSAVIDDGLSAGELVVTEGQYRIEAGSLVEVLANLAGSPG